MSKYRILKETRGPDRKSLLIFESKHGFLGSIVKGRTKSIKYVIWDRDTQIPFFFDPKTGQKIGPFLSARLESALRHWTISAPFDEIYAKAQKEFEDKGPSGVSLVSVVLLVSVVSNLIAVAGIASTALSPTIRALVIPALNF